MAVRLVVFNDSEPEIGITLDYVPPRTPGKAQGWHGTCTQCGKRVHYWTEGKAFQYGQEHVNSHIEG